MNHVPSISRILSKEFTEHSKHTEVHVDFLVVDIALIGFQCLSSDICFMNRLYCNTPNEISSKAIKENFKCTRVHLPTNVDVANLESDRLVARQKKQDLNEFDILDKKS